MQFYGEQAGPLPLRNRFIRLTIGETVWIVRASRAIELAVEYYRHESDWYEERELRDAPELKQPSAKELRGLIEINEDLTIHVKESRLEDLNAKLVAGPEVWPAHGDKCWWFEEQGGSVEEVTNIPPDRQNPSRLLWFSEAWGKSHGMFLESTTPARGQGE